jgi:hypothetical protein
MPCIFPTLLSLEIKLNTDPKGACIHRSALSLIPPLGSGPDASPLLFLRRASSVYSVLLLLLRTSSNFKIRIQAAAALAVPLSRKGEVLSVLVEWSSGLQCTTKEPLIYLQLCYKFVFWKLPDVVCIASGCSMHCFVKYLCS